MTGTELKKPLLTKLNRLSELASKDPRLKFTSLAHLLDEECLTDCYRELNRYAAYGVDQVSWKTYGENLKGNLTDLISRMKGNRYRAQDIRRAWIPKPDGGRRPLGILILKDKIVQRGVAKILGAIYEQDFLDVSFGFRPKRNAHDALRSLEMIIMKRGVEHLLDVDIKGYFDHIDHGWLMKMLEERIADRSKHCKTN